MSEKFRTLFLTSIAITFLMGAIIAVQVPAARAGGSAAVTTGSLPVPGARCSEHIYGNLPGLTNVGRVTTDIYRGAQPDKEGYATLKKMGVRTVINLRTSMSEKKQVEEAGMRSIEVPIPMSGDELKKRVDRVVALMADPANQPVFVHCRQGQDRTGIVVAAYRMKMQGWSLADAEAEMQSFGFNDVWVHFKRFIRSYGNGLAKK